MYPEELMRRAANIANLRTQHNRYNKILKDLNNNADILHIIEASKEQIAVGIDRAVSQIVVIEEELAALMGVEAL